MRVAAASMAALSIGMSSASCAPVLSVSHYFSIDHRRRQIGQTITKAALMKSIN